MSVKNVHNILLIIYSILITKTIHKTLNYIIYGNMTIFDKVLCSIISTALDTDVSKLDFLPEVYSLCEDIFEV